MPVYLALGSNLGDRKANLQRALSLLPPEVRVEAVSMLYESTPQPPAPPPDYLNAACRISTALEPHELLAYVKRIEREMGRVDGPRWSPRIIDLDIALYNDLVLDDPDLVIPHERIVERNFVLRPLLDLDAALVHPRTGERLADMASTVGDKGLAVVGSIGWEDSPLR